MTKLLWRFMARFIDNFIFGLLGMILFFVLSKNLLTHFNLYLYSCFFLYDVIMHGLCGQTLGKKCFDIKLVDINEKSLGIIRIILRELIVFIILYLSQIDLILKSYTVSNLLKLDIFGTMALGLILIDFSPYVLSKKNKRLLHDTLLMTKVIDKKSTIPG